MTTESQVVDAQPVEALARQEPQTQALAPQSLTPAQMLSIAVQQDAPVEKIEKLMDLQQRWEANEARKAFEVAMVAFSAKVPTILKTRVVDFTTSKGRTHYTHAGLPETVEQIQELMAECQLSRRWKDEEPKKPGNIRIRCIVSHITGHSESFSAEAPPDESGNKNAAQDGASIITYLRRTTLFSVLGLVANDELDDDGAGGKKTEPPKPKSSSLTDPAERDARLEFGKLVRARANAPTMGNDIVKVAYANVQSLSGLSSVSDCLSWLRNNALATIDASGNVTDVGLSSNDFDDIPQAPAAAPGTQTPAPSPEPATQPPSSEALPFACDECLQRFKVKPASHKDSKGQRCLGVVTEVK